VVQVAQAQAEHQEHQEQAEPQVLVEHQEQAEHQVLVEHQVLAEHQEQVVRMVFLLVKHIILMKVKTVMFRGIKFCLLTHQPQQHKH